MKVLFVIFWKFWCFIELLLIKVEIIWFKSLIIAIKKLWNKSIPASKIGKLREKKWRRKRKWVRRRRKRLGLTVSSNRLQFSRWKNRSKRSNSIFSSWAYLSYDTSLITSNILRSVSYIIYWSNAIFMPYWCHWLKKDLGWERPKMDRDRSMRTANGQ